MPVVVLALEHTDLELGFALGAELQLEHLAPLIGRDIERIVGAPATKGQVFRTNNAEPRAHAGELVRNRFSIHILMLGRARGGGRLSFEPVWLAIGE